MQLTMRHLEQLLWMACVLAALTLGFMLGHLSALAADDTACSITNLKHPEQDIQVPDLFQPPVFPGGGGDLGAGCRGWNACPCLDDCEAQKIAACEPEPIT